ncbi:MAG: chromosome segregation protein SMC, partial [Ignavibacteria bacterium RBG_13_36_8]
EIDIQIVNYKENIEKLKIEIQEKQNEIKNTTIIFEEKLHLVNESKNILKTQTDEVLRRTKNFSILESKLSGLKDNYHRTNENINKLNDTIQNITTSIAKTVGYLEELGIEKKQIEEKLYASESLYSEKQKEKDKLEKEITTLKEKELEEKGALKTLKDKIEFLKTLIANLEGISNASKALIESKEWTSNPKNLFADIGDADDKHRFALEASLKSVLNNLLVDNISDLEKAILYLKKNDLGKASFYLLKKEKKKNILLSSVADLALRSKIRKISKDKSFDSWAYSVVQTDAKWKPYFKNVLLKTAIILDLNSALKLNSKYPDFDFVTLDGDIVQSNGVIQAGSAPKIDDTLFGRKQLLDKLIGDIAGFESRLKQLRSEIEQKELALTKIDLKNLSDNGKLLLNDLNNIEKQISQLEFEKKKASEEIEKIQKGIHDLVIESNNLDSEILKLEEDVKIQKEDKETAETKLKQLENTLSEAETEYNNIVSEQNKRKLELERLLGQLQNIENAIARAEKNKSSVIETTEKRNLDIRKFENEIEEIQIQLTEAKIEYDNHSSFRENLLSEEKEIEVELNSIKKESSEYEESLNTYRGNRQEISDNIHNLDLKLNEIKLRIENLLVNIKENYSLELELKEFDDLESYNFEETSKGVHSLKDKLRNLGPINLLAYSEYEEEKGRFDFLQEQRNDLIQSEKDLIKTIQEINNTAQNLFLQTFEEIRNNFKNIFQTLFNPGDEADLVLDENIDPLEAKIEIIAKPKGKRPTSIELLSGGEKTLTATALLFAIYLVKPSPFCILDEVDAPLDDANIDRFAKLTKEFSKKTQFIIVTHNKRTMESTETMYGVTMQEEGISKIVGVKFNEELAVSS